MIQFTATRPSTRSLNLFEKQYEPGLAMTITEKVNELKQGHAIWMYIGGHLAGECFGTPGAFVATEDWVSKSESRLLDIEGLIYCASTTILPKYRRKGYGKLLVAYWNGYVKGLGFTKVAGHASRPEMFSIRKLFGATVRHTVPNWGGTDRDAKFYIQPL